MSTISVWQQLYPVCCNF